MNESENGYVSTSLGISRNSNGVVSHLRFDEGKWFAMVVDLTEEKKGHYRELKKVSLEVYLKSVEILFV